MYYKFFGETKVNKSNNGPVYFLQVMIDKGLTGENIIVHGLFIKTLQYSG